MTTTDRATATALAVQPLSPSLGAAITGVDVNELDDAAFDNIRKAFVDHRMLVIKRQQLTPRQLVAFAERWGEPLVHPLTPHLPDTPPVQAIENTGKKATLNEHWHTDMSFEPVPPKMTILHALQVPSVGGDTAFADQYAAYDSLSDGMKALLDGRRAVHSSDAFARIVGRDKKDAPSATHPIFRTHPDSGRKALYVCRAFTTRIDGMTTSESKGILDFLFERGARLDFTYRHRWEQGDLVMWDNRCLLHYAIHDHGDEPRLLHRVTVKGEVPA
jgi:taurine dioxygenase